MYLLLTYDINTETTKGQKRLAKVARACERYGMRVQNSVFEINADSPKLTTLMDIYHCLQGSGGEEITLPQDVMQGAGRCIRRMVALGG